MKRFFSLLALLVMIVTTGGYVYAGDVYTLSFGAKKNYVAKKNTTEDTDLFQLNFTADNADKYACNYDNMELTHGMKIKATAGMVSFTTTSDANITIVQGLGYASTYYLNFDGTDFSSNDRKDNSSSKYGVYTLTNVKAGSHKIQGNSKNKEVGLVYVKIEYTGSEKQQLTEPKLNFNPETGSVTISQTENKDVYYTIDGTDPSTDNGTKYTSAFTVEDGTTIKAIAIGDGTTTINSKVASYYALLKTVTIQKPVITSVNGTVAISCATPGTTFKYSVNGGDLQDYSYPFTLTEDGTVKAVASRENCTDVEGDEVSVTAVKNTVATKTIMLDFDKFDLTKCVNGVSNSVLNGKTGTDAEGYRIELNNNNNKDWSTLNKMTIDGTEYNSIKLSNGAENILHMPEGVKASRITFYSVINSTENNAVCGWQNVNGAQEYKSIPMGALTKYPNADTEYDVRVYPLNNATEQISFTNAGIQMAFVIALDIVDETPATKKVEINSESGLISFSSTQAYTLPEGLTAYTATCDGSKVTLNKVEDGIVAANQGVVLEGTPNVTYTLNATDAEGNTEWTKNELKNTAANTYTTGADETDVYVLICNSNNKGQFARLNANQTIPVGKAYLKVVGSNAKSLSVGFGDDTTGINTIEAAQGTQNACYNLNGQRISKPAKGLYIMNGKKFVK